MFQTLLNVTAHREVPSELDCANDTVKSHSGTSSIHPTPNSLRVPDIKPAIEHYGVLNHFPEVLGMERLLRFQGRGTFWILLKWTILQLGETLPSEEW